MKQKSPKNRIDQLILKLQTEFQRIPNFGMMINDEKGNRLFNFVISKISELQDFRTLYQNYYIPATNRAIVEANREINTSVFKNWLRISQEDLKENLFETIRLGYVGLFHKIENYNRDLINVTELFLLDEEYPEGKIDIEKFAEKSYDFKFFNWQNDLSIFKINWVCNCVKHYNGFPLKEPKPQNVSRFKINEKIKISKEELVSDFDYVMNVYFIVMLQRTLFLGIVAKHFNDSLLQKLDLTTVTGQNILTQKQELDAKLKALLNY